MRTQPREFGAGPLSRACAAIYTLLVVEALLLLTLAPGLILLTLLERDASNLPLAALALVPLGPALSAALVALHRPRDLGDLRPAAAFGRAYRRNAGAVLRLWVPMLISVTIVGINLTHLEVAGVPAAWAGPLLLIAGACLLWGLNALVVCSFFTFRTRDAARLAWYLVARTPGVALGASGLLIVAVVVTGLWSEAVLALLGSALALILLHTYHPLISCVQREFTA